MTRVGSAFSARLGTPGNLVLHTAVRRGVTAFTHSPVLADLGRGKGEAGGDPAASGTRKAGKAHPDRRSETLEASPSPRACTGSLAQPEHQQAWASSCLRTPCWDYRDVPSRASFLPGFWESNSGSQACKRSAFPVGPFRPLHKCRSCFPAPISDNLTRLPRLALMSISSRLIFLGHSESTLPSMAKPLLSFSVSFLPFLPSHLCQAPPLPGRSLHSLAP